jgi:hypothetical protein
LSSSRAAVFSRLAKLRPALVIVSSRTYTFATPTALSQTIARLRADGAEVVWLEDTPVPPSDIPVCLSEHLTDIELCSYSRASGLDDPTLRDKLNETAKRDGASVIDTVPWLCTVRTCPPVIADTAVYFDDSHVSNSGPSGFSVGDFVEPMFEMMSTG